MKNLQKYFVQSRISWLASFSGVHYCVDTYLGLGHCPSNSQNWSINAARTESLLMTHSCHTWKMSRSRVFFLKLWNGSSFEGFFSLFSFSEFPRFHTFFIASFCDRLLDALLVLYRLSWKKKIVNWWHWCLVNCSIYYIFWKCFTNTWKSCSFRTMRIYFSLVEGCRKWSTTM